MCHISALLVTCALRDYGTATWKGGDEECDHKQKTARNDGGRENIQGFHGSSKLDSDKGDMNYKDTCAKCGAKRIDNQLGLEPTPEAYLENMVPVFREVWRVLRDDGMLWLNMGDSYGVQGGGGESRMIELHGHGSGIHTHAGKGQLSGKTKAKNGLKPKDLCMMPARLAMALQAGFSECQNCGLELRTDLWPIRNGHKVCLECLYRGIDLNVVVQSQQGWYLRSMMPWVKRSASIILK